MLSSLAMRLASMSKPALMITGVILCWWRKVKSWCAPGMRGILSRIVLMCWWVVGVPLVCQREMSRLMNSWSSIFPVRYASTLCWFEVLK